MENKQTDIHQNGNSQIDELNNVYQECLNYLESFTKDGNSNIIEEHKSSKNDETDSLDHLQNNDPDNESNNSKLSNESSEVIIDESRTEKSKENFNESVTEIENTNKEATDWTKTETTFKVENEMKTNESVESINSLPNEPRSDRLRKLSKQLPKIIITQSNSSLNKQDFYRVDGTSNFGFKMGAKKTPPPKKSNLRSPPPLRNKAAYGVYPKRLVSKMGMENVALISNVPFERIRLLNDTFHTLINLRWRWIVTGTVVVHFGIWLIFAVWWYVAALAHYDLEPDPPRRACVTGGKDFVTIFLASVEAQTTIGFGDRAIDEECPEAIFLFIMQLILGTGLSGVLTCVVYAKLTRPEKLSRDGVGFSKKAVICLRDGHLCLMMRAWDLNYDHIIGSEFSAHFITTHRTAEGETLHHYARSLKLQHREFLLWPVTLVHVIDEHSPLFRLSPEVLCKGCYEITVSLKGASASMGTFTQSQSSYLPREVIWGHRFPPVVKYEKRKQKYVIDHKKLDVIEPVDTPYCSASQLISSADPQIIAGSPTSFSERISSFMLERSSSFRRISPQRNTLDPPSS